MIMNWTLSRINSRNNIGCTTNDDIAAMAQKPTLEDRSNSLATLGDYYDSASLLHVSDTEIAYGARVQTNLEISDLVLPTSQRQESLRRKESRTPSRQAKLLTRPTMPGPSLSSRFLRRPPLLAASSNNNENANGVAESCSPNHNCDITRIDHSKNLPELALSLREGTRTADGGEENPENDKRRRASSPFVSLQSSLFSASKNIWDSSKFADQVGRIPLDAIDCKFGIVREKNSRRSSIATTSLIDNNHRHTLGKVLQY
jgi:hypothetical protein